MGSGGTGGQQGQGALASSATDKQRAITFMEHNLLPDTQAAGGMCAGGGVVHPPMLAPTAPSIFNAAKPDTGLPGLSAWAVDSGLSAAMTVWSGQAGRLMGRLQTELSGLRSTKSLFLDQDTGTGGDLSGVTSPLFTNPLASNPPVTNPLVTNPLIGTNPAAGTDPLVTIPMVTSPSAPNSLIGTNPAFGGSPVTGTLPTAGTNPAFQQLPTSLDQM